MQAACEYKHSTKRHSGLESLPPDRPQGILLCYQLLKQKTTYLSPVGPWLHLPTPCGYPPAFQMALYACAEATESRASRPAKKNQILS